MTAKKHKKTRQVLLDAPETDFDDIYLPVCCGEFGLRQAADLRDLWEATWSQDRRGREETAQRASPFESEERSPKTTKDHFEK